MSAREHLLQEIEKFLVETGMGAGTFGKRAMNDGKFVARLRRGADLTLDSADNIRKFMADVRSQSVAPVIAA